LKASQSNHHVAAILFSVSNFEFVKTMRKLELAESFKAGSREWAARQAGHATALDMAWQEVRKSRRNAGAIHMQR
jgi:hypothetical protein